LERLRALLLPGCGLPPVCSSLLVCGVVRKPSAGEMLQCQFTTNLRVIAPYLFPGRGIQGDDGLVWSADIKVIADLQGGDLECGFFRVARLTTNVTRFVMPCKPQLRDIFRGYLCQRRVALPHVGSAIRMPFAVRY